MRKFSYIFFLCVGNAVSHAHLVEEQRERKEENTQLQRKAGQRSLEYD